MCEACARLSDARLVPNNGSTTTQTLSSNTFSAIPTNAVEGADVAADATTTAAMSVGGTFTGSLSGRGDRDWVAIDLQEGQSYDISLGGTGANGVRDTYLRIYDASGNLIASNDDGGPGLSSFLSQLTVANSGTYFISAGSYADRGTGDYAIEVTGRTTPITISETADAAANVSTSYSMNVGEIFEGSLSGRGDRDWVAIELDAGQIYDISLTGGGRGNVRDTYLRIYDGNGNLIASNDDGGPGLSSLLSNFTVGSSGTYFISAGSYRDRGYGNYQIEVTGEDIEFGLTETVDAAADSSTQYSMEVGDTFEGTLSSRGDRDWVAIELEEGQVYDIALNGGGRGNVRDTYLRLYDGDGNLIASNDDGGPGLSSLLASLTVETGGTYYISAGSYGDRGTGNYEIEVTGQPIPTGLVETIDAANSSSTFYSMSAGEVFSGSLEGYRDRDWVAIDLEEGQLYDISLDGVGGNGVRDTYLRIYDGNGNLIASNDDGGPGLYSLLSEFSVGSSGTYYISAGSYRDRGQGDYEISVTDVTPPPAPPPTPTPTPDPGPAPDPETNPLNDTLALQLTNGYWESTGRSARNFNVATGGVITVNYDGLTAEAQTLASTALGLWSDLTGLQFQYASTGAQLTFDDNDSGAYSYSSVAGSTIYSSHVNVSTSWISYYGTSLNSYSFQTYIHEIGHALGLGHAGNYNGSASFDPSVNLENDSWQASVMSYFSQTENTLVDASWALAVTPQVADILAIRELYGTTGTTRTGDTTYGDNANSGDTMATLTGMNSSITYTIVDDGGIDTLDFSSSYANQLIDLNAEAVSNVRGLTGNLVIARGTVIENAIGGSGNDTLVGNIADNRLEGRAGSDTLTGNYGFDTFVFASGSGNDTVTDFEDGIDMLEFGFGISSLADLTIGMNGSDTVIQFTNGSITLTGIDQALISADDFQFV